MTVGVELSPRPALELCDVAVQLGGRPVLSGVNLACHEGELVGLIGPNGAGKTTLLRAVLGLLRPQQGEVLVDGRPASRARGSVGYVPQRQSFRWDFPIRVLDAVGTGRTHLRRWGRGPSAEDRRMAADALSRVDMTDLADRVVGELSGGQRQRVLVARALALQPRVLLLDEPFTGLDVPTQELLTELFGGLAAEGRAVLMTTHDLPLAAVMCDRLALLNRRIVAQGPPETLHDQEAWTRVFGLGASSRLLGPAGASTGGPVSASTCNEVGAVQLGGAL